MTEGSFDFANFVICESGFKYENTHDTYGKETDA